VVREGYLLRDELLELLLDLLEELRDRRLRGLEERPLSADLLIFVASVIVFLSLRLIESSFGQFSSD
jgi:hypothetical protein